MGIVALQFPFIMYSALVSKSFYLLTSFLQIIISGQLHISNRLDLPVEVKVVAKVGSHDQRSVGQAGHTIPSYILEMSEIHGIKFHCPGRNNPWSKEVFIGGEKLQENNLVKVRN